MSEQNSLRVLDGGRDRFHYLVAASPAMQRVVSLVERVAPSDLPLLLQGETGVGKEVIARSVHDASANKGPFVAINCAALPSTLAERELFGHVRGAFTGADQAGSGVFEQADGGTLLLDEIGELDRSSQAKLLRTLELGTVRRLGDTRERTVRVRLIAATNRDLIEDVEAGRFREDLFFRIAGVTIHVPPLRERREDIEPLIERFIRESVSGKDVPLIKPELIEELAKRRWRGNVRELKLAVRRAVVLGGSVLTSSDFPVVPLAKRRGMVGPESEGAPLFAGKSWREIEQEVLTAALARCGSIRAAASELEIPRSTLADRIKRYQSTSP